MRQGADHLVLDVPAEEDVALGEPLLGGGEEVVGADPLAAVDAVEVGAADADGPDVVVTEELFSGLDVHGATSRAGAIRAQWRDCTICALRQTGYGKMAPPTGL